MINVFLPVYNEEKIIKDHVLEVYEICKELKQDFKVFIVDDNSKDKTPKICEELEKEYPNIKHLFYTNGPSRRENLGEAFLSIPDNELIVFMDIDLAADISRTKDLVSYVQNGYDIAIGSRYKGIKCVRGMRRLTISKVYNGTIQTMFNSKINDHQCGFKAFKSEKIKKVIRDMGYDKKLKRGWFWDAELLLRAQKEGYSIKEFPVFWEAGKQSSFNFERELRIVKYLPNIYKKIGRIKNPKVS